MTKLKATAVSISGRVRPSKHPYDEMATSDVPLMVMDRYTGRKEQSAETHRTDLADVYEEIRGERARAHAKHGAMSMESTPEMDLNRLAILLEEVGEVAKEFNEARNHNVPVDKVALRKELIQVAAMATAWAEAIKVPHG